MKLKTLLITTIGAFAIAGANAGETVPSEKAVIEEEAPSLTGDLSAGYDTRYIYRGLWFGDNPVWGNLAVAKEISPKLTLSANAFYIDIADNDLAYSEVNLGGGIAYESEFGTFALGAIYYAFLDGFAGDNGTGPGGQTDTFELNITYSRELFAGINMSLMAAYDFRIEAEYFELGLDKSFTLCDWASLDIAGAVGYGLNDYYSFALAGDDADGFTHILVTIALPMQVAETVTVTPYIAANFSGDARKNGNSGSIGDDEVFGGISVAVSF